MLTNEIEACVFLIAFLYFQKAYVFSTTMNVNKQRKTVGAAEHFPDGSITKIIFNNFLTYEYMEIFPGPNLNVIIGPNGTGKSTIMCGLCLAVGGTPGILGRSELLADYIKHGSEEGSVEVFIRDSKLGKDRRLSIVLHRYDHSDYFVDGEKVTQTKLRGVVESYNIQIDNPCTFLAQDKVKSFAEQKSHWLLKNTEKAVGKKLVDLHDSIHEVRFDRSPFLHTKCLEDSLNSVQSELKTLVPLIENYRRRETMREHIRLLQCKQLHLEYLESEMIAHERMQYKRMKEAELEETKEAMLPIKRLLQQQKIVNERHKCEEKNAMDGLLLVEKETEKLLAVESVDESVLNAKKDYERAKKECDEWEERLSAARTEHNLLEEKLTIAEREFASIEKENSAVKEEYLEWNMKEEELDKQKSVLNNKINEIDSRMRGLYSSQFVKKCFYFCIHGFQHLIECFVLSVMGAIDADQQLFRKKFVVLKGNGREMKCGEAWQWYESQKEKFRHPVFVPLLFMSLVSDDAAVYLENIIAHRDLLMFIFRCKEDEMLLTDKRHPWKINSCIISDNEIAHFQKQEMVPAHLCSLGFTCMASNLYTAPDPVKAYLNSVASLHKIPIGTQTTENRLDEVCEILKNSHRLFLTNSLRVRISISRYSGNLSVRTEALRTSLRFLVVHTALPKNNVESLSELEKQLAKLKELSKEMRLAQERIGEAEKNIAQGRERCRRKMDAFIKKKDARNIISNQLRSKAARMQAIENDKPDLNVAAQKFQKVKSEIIKKSFERAEKIVELMERRKLLIQNALFASLSAKKVMKELDILQKRLHLFEEEYESKSDAIRHTEITVKLAMQTVQEDKQRLYESIGIEDSSTNEADEALEILKRAFDFHAIPNTKEAVQVEMARQQGKLDALHSEGEKKDIERFEELTRKRELLTKEMDAKKKDVVEWENKLNNLLEQWLLQLEGIVGKLNQYFSSFFESMGCSGEVHLQKPDDKHDILKYGIIVTAKFREGERLRQLTHQTQSGGERSVITMLYILALQKLTVVPFRCVDEINQGMDPKNEKLVFNMIVDMLSKDNDLTKTQYFILTPKLVPDLKFNQKTKIHCIHSGGKLTKRKFNNRVLSAETWLSLLHFIKL
uniref:Structural maintenance of chromosomes protein 5 n=1 Tax=Elaeophora elaphi TaxID=1147741 RepID=A0A0R3RHS8_9BILA